MVNETRKQMREPRRARATGVTAEAWYYINPKTVDVLAEIVDPGNGGRWVTTARLTRKQLEQALAIMERL